MNREAWLAERRTGIGGSDVAPILGLSPWQSPVDVFLDKRGEIADQPENDAMKWGILLEPVVRQEYSNQTGRAVMMPGAMLRHPKHSFMLANLDGYTEGNRIFEAKTARSGEGWGEPGSDEVPQHYLFQVQHYMAVTGYPVADLAVLIGGSDFRIYTIDADAELHEMLIEAEAAFWRRVVDNEPPEIVTYDDAIAMWGRRSIEKKVVATAEVEQSVNRLREIKSAIDLLKQQEEAEKLVVMTALEEADTLVDLKGDPLVTWKAGKPVERVDTKALRAAYPDICSQFTTEAEPTRRFLLKKEK